MSPRQRKLVFGGVLPLVSVAVAGGAIVLATLASFGAFPRPAPAQVSEDPRPEDLAAALARAGITAESLAAVGASDQAVTRLVGFAESHFDAERFSTMRQADESVRTARHSERSLRQTVQSGHGDANDATALRAAEQTRAAEESSRDQLVGLLRTAVGQAFAQDQLATLEQIRANSAWDLPVQYLVVSRTEREWVALRDALANLRISARLGEEPDPRVLGLGAPVRRRPGGRRGQVAAGHAAGPGGNGPRAGPGVWRLSPAGGENSPGGPGRMATRVDGMHGGDATERLAEIAHDLWRDAMERRGWSYGPSYDAEHKRHDALVPFGRLDKHDRRQALLGITALELERDLIGSIWYERGPARPLTLEEMRTGLPVTSCTGDLIAADSSRPDRRPSMAPAPDAETGRVVAWAADEQGWLGSVTVAWPDGTVTTHHPADRDLMRAGEHPRHAAGGSR